MERNRRTAFIGALTLVALITSFALAVRLRGPSQVQLVVVAPAGTEVSVEGARARDLPEQPSTSAGLASHYFTAAPGDHVVHFREPGGSARSQTIRIPAQHRPVLYTLLRDTLRALREVEP